MHWGPRCGEPVLQAASKTFTFNLSNCAYACKVRLSVCMRTAHNESAIMNMQHALHVACRVVVANAECAFQTRCNIIEHNILKPAALRTPCTHYYAPRYTHVQHCILIEAIKFGNRTTHAFIDDVQ